MNSKPGALIIGGGIVGAFVAWHLRETGYEGRIQVLERDPTYRFSSTALSVASIRTQFGCDVNVSMSLYGAEVLRNAPALFGSDVHPDFVERGYLIVGDANTASARAAAAARQNAAGADVEAMGKVELAQRFPWLNIEDLEIATYGRRHEGWFDAWTLHAGVRRAARDRGVEFIRAEAAALEVQGAHVAAARLVDGGRVAADWIVIAAGAWSAPLAESIGVDLPVRPRKRTVFRVRAPLETVKLPMVFDTSGAWIRPEGSGFVAGIAPADDCDPDAPDDFAPDLGLFEERLWPALAHRIPALEALRVEQAWAGLYEVNTLDHNGIVGPHDEYSNLLFATGFSGHGVMHAAAAGRGVAEWIRFQGYRSLDLTPLGYGRVRRGEPLHETIIY